MGIRSAALGFLLLFAWSLAAGIANARLVFPNEGALVHQVNDAACPQFIAFTSRPDFDFPAISQDCAGGVAESLATSFSVGDQALTFSGKGSAPEGAEYVAAPLFDPGGLESGQPTFMDVVEAPARIRIEGALSAAGDAHAFFTLARTLRGPVTLFEVSSLAGDTGPFAIELLLEPSRYAMSFSLAGRGDSELGTGRSSLEFRLFAVPEPALSLLCLLGAIAGVSLGRRGQ